MLKGSARAQPRDPALQPDPIEETPSVPKSEPPAGRPLIVAMIVGPLLFWLAVLAGLFVWLT